MTHVADSIPYPWPYDGLLEPRRTALLIAADQPALASLSPGAPAAHDVLEALAEQIRLAGGTVVRVRYGSRAPRRSPLMPETGTPHWELLGSPHPDDVVVDAPGWDATFGSGLLTALRSRSIATVVLGGAASEITVDSTVRTLNDRGFECLVLTDACAPLDPELGRHAHASLTMSGGIFGALGTVTALSAALAAARPPEVAP